MEMAAGTLVACWLAGCSLRPPARAPETATQGQAVAHTNAALQVMGDFLQGALMRHLVNGYNATSPGLHLEWMSRGFNAHRWTLIYVNGWEPAMAAHAQSVNLRPAITALNANLSTLLPGIGYAFAVGNALYALPFSQVVWGLSYDASALGQLRPAPGQPWTIAAFRQACTELKGLLQKGKLPGLTSVLPPLLAGGAAPSPGSAGVFDDATLLAGWVQGYGGWMFKDGAFDLTNAGALAAFSEIVALQREFSPPQARPRAASAARPGAALGAASAALAFASNDASLPRGRARARFPLLPAAPVVPCQPVGFALSPRLGPAASAPAAVRDAVVRFMLWLYEPAQQQQIAVGGAPPIIRSPSLQAAFWGGRLSPGAGYAPLGDWRHFVYPLTGVPAAAPLGLLLAALNGAVAAPSGLRHAVKHAEDGLNKWLAAQ